MSGEVRLTAALVAAAGLVFLVENLFLLPKQGTSIIFLPVALFLLDCVAATLILYGNRTLRTGVLMILVIGILVDIVIFFGVPVWMRVVTGVLAAAQIAALVLLNTKSLREHFELVDA